MIGQDGADDDSENQDIKVNHLEDSEFVLIHMFLWRRILMYIIVNIVVQNWLRQGSQRGHCCK